MERTNHVNVVSGVTGQIAAPAIGRYKIRNDPALPHAVNINRRSRGVVAQVWLKHKGNPVASRHKAHDGRKIGGIDNILEADMPLLN